MKDEEKICEFGQVDVGGQRAGECVSGDVSVISSQGEAGGGTVGHSLTLV